jgi:predicted dehydrogenase
MARNGKRRYALVGIGGRAPMYVDPLATRFSEECELVGLCDVNPARMDYQNKRLAGELGYHKVPTFHADDFDKMVGETGPDTVIVTTIDAFHHKYVIRAMELGCDAITEKPMTIDAEKCRAILDAVQRTGRNLRVAQNYRWTPGTTQVRELIAAGTIGEIIHVDVEEMLDTNHGADFFRRWHREKDKSGGLLVSKAAHHFDSVNWWLDAVPETVFGMGRLAFYGRENAEKRGVEVKYDRYTGQDTKGDPFALDLSASESMRELYLEAEKHDGYQRDRNVFGDNITIEDTMSVLVRYRTGAVLNYSMNAYLPREGLDTVFNGTKGRIEYREEHDSHIIAGQSDEELANAMKWESQLIVHPMFGRAYKVDVREAKGAHGGGDPMLQAQIFSQDSKPDPLGRDAGHGQGAAAVLVGIAANRSFETGAPVQISELCPELGDATHLSELT